MSEESQAAKDKIHKIAKKAKQNFTIENTYFVFVLLVTILGSFVAARGFISWETQGYLVYLSSIVILVYLFSLYQKRFFSWIETAEGKFAYGVVVAVSTIAAQIGADQTIRYFLQTNPDQFPSAQKFLLVILTIVLLVVEIILAMYVTFIKNFLLVSMYMMANIFLNIFGVKFFNVSFKKYVLSLIPYLLGLIFLIRSISLVSSAFGVKDKNQNSINILEEAIIYSSFLPNKTDAGYVKDSYGKHLTVSKLICKNVNENDFVSPVSPEQEIPDIVVDASLMPHIDGEVSSRFIYKLSHCENSNDPDHIRINDHH